MILEGIPGGGSLGNIPLANPLGGIPGGHMREILGRGGGGDIPGEIPGPPKMSLRVYAKSETTNDCGSCFLFCVIWD